jgi:hypothetical protein
MTQIWKDIAVVRELYRYPVKGMRGEALQEAEIYWHGIEGDRRFAFADAVDSKSGFPWMTGRRKAQMIQYRLAGDPLNGSLTVTTPAGRELGLHGGEILSKMTALYDTPVTLVRLSRGCFDSMPLSIISAASVAALSGEVGVTSNVRRFRPNIVVDALDEKAFAEDLWAGQSLRFGEEHTGAHIRVDRPNKRCGMINLDPDNAESNPAMLKFVTQTREAQAGMYASCVQPGAINVGDTIKMLMHF